MRIIIVLIFSGYFLVGSLFPHNSVGELSKLPELISHYQEHKKGDTQAISFLKFLFLHYVPASSHDGSDSHANLPLYQHSIGANFISPVVIYTYIRQTFFIFEFSSAYSIFYNYIFSFSFFQPPR